MEVTRSSFSDAITARDRALQAMDESEDLELRGSLWRLAVKFHLKAKREAMVAAIGALNDEWGERGRDEAGPPLASGLERADANW